jgi:hypothetical protein
MAYSRHTTPGKRNQGKSRRQARIEQATAQAEATPEHPESRPRRRKVQFQWSDTILRSEWAIYRSAIRTVREAGIPFLLGGGFAGATFTGRWRDTKDIDFYVHPRDRQAAVCALAAAGFEDYYSRLAYDRKWIYRSVKSNVIVDIIWAMANQRAQVDQIWFERAGKVEIRGESLLVIPMEEFMWCKLYIMQRDHCDWPDIFNLLYKSGPRMDWNHLIWRLDRDVAVLKSALGMFAWLCPAAARRLPASLWRRLKLRREIPPLRRGEDRVHLLDSRGWFGATQPPGQKLEV